MAHTPDALPVLLLDFDGTVSLGDGPVLAYAEAAVQGLPASEAARVRDTLGDYLAGRLGSRWPDGYLAVQDLTRGLVDPATLDAAYAMSRRRLQAGELPIHAPAGLVDFLTALEHSAERVLVTNAPCEGVTEVLQRLDLVPHLDRVITSAKKPDGWSTLLPQILGDRPASSAVSVGDVFTNDIAPLIPYGTATAFIDRFGATDLPATPTWTAPSLPQLYPTLAEWLNSAHLEGH